jgi:uncharacterized protein (DUF302 family)
MNYGFSRQFDLSFEQARRRVSEELSREGFGILTEIDVQAILKKKLGREFPPYVILGACNPPLAHRALTVEPLLGLLLPCNVIIYRDGQGKTTVAAIDAKAMMSLVEREEILPVAEEVNKKLKRVIANI